jgi:hypothetical protein
MSETHQWTLLPNDVGLALRSRTSIRSTWLPLALAAIIVIAALVVRALLAFSLPTWTASGGGQRRNAVGSGTPRRGRPGHQIHGFATTCRVRSSRTGTPFRPDRSWA